MKMIAVACAASLSLAACATNPTEFLNAYADAANTLDPGCAKDVQINLLPLMMPWGPIPFVTGSYRKGCNLDQFAPPSRIMLPAATLAPDPIAARLDELEGRLSAIEPAR